METKPRLTKPDWIQAAFRALTIGGPQAIKAETIARDLNVSKGSFYWHFKDVPGLRLAMITHWQQIATNAVIAALEDSKSPAKTRLRRLMEIATSDNNTAYGGALAEAAIRDWARYDNMVKAAVNEVDKQRINYVKDLFVELRHSETDAQSNANVLYGALIGLMQLSNLGGLNPQHEILNLLDRMLSAPTN